MTNLQDLRDFLDAPKLTLPIGGREYVVTPATAQTWLRLQALAEDAEKAAKGDPEALKRANDTRDVELYRMALGPVFDEMLPHVTGTELQKAGLTAWFWQCGQQALAEASWNSGGKAPTGTLDSTTTPAAKSKTASRSTTTSRRKPSNGSQPPV